MSATEEKIKLHRTSKGKRPQYFNDVNMDRLLSMNMVLMQELSVTNDRLEVLERILEEKGVVERKQISDYRIEGDLEKEFRAKRLRFIRRCVRTVTNKIEELSGRAYDKHTQHDVQADIV